MTTATATSARDLAAARLRVAAGRYLAASKTLFGDGVYKLALRSDESVPTFATTANWITRWNPAKALIWTPDEIAGVLVHELLHLLNRHFDRVGSRDRRLANIAGDLAINQTVRALGLSLPDGGVEIAAFGFPPSLTMEEYYDLLIGAGQQGQQGQQGQDGQPGTDPQCGGCAGNPASDEPGDDDPAGRGEAEGEAIARALAEQIQREAAKGQGNIPAELVAWAGNILRAPRVRWQDRLTRAVRNAIAYRRGAVEPHFRGVSRRQWGVGIGPGRPMLPATHAPVPLVWAFGDTSGSMGGGEGSLIEAVCVEIGGIARALAAPVKFWAIDANLHGGPAECRTAQDVAKALKGGGGTDFRPAFDLIARTRADRRPSIMVYVTDGCGDAPSAPPPGVRVIWCLVGGGVRPTPWGEEIHVEGAK